MDETFARIRRNVAQGVGLAPWEAADLLDLLAGFDRLFDECARLTAEIMQAREELRRMTSERDFLALRVIADCRLFSPGPRVNGSDDLP